MILVEEKYSKRTFYSRFTKVWGVHQLSFSQRMCKMFVICLSESAEVLMWGLECSITRADVEMVQHSQTLTQLQPPPPSLLSLHHTFSLSPFHFCDVFSHSLTRRSSLFLGPSPLCLTILLSFCFSPSLQSSISARSFALPLTLHLFYPSGCPLVPLCIQQCLCVCWPWFCFHHLRFQTLPCVLIDNAAVLQG